MQLILTFFITGLWCDTCFSECLFEPVLLFQNRNTVVQSALIGKWNQLPQTLSVPQFRVQPQEGAVHLCSAPQVLLCASDSEEKISQEV